MNRRSFVGHAFIGTLLQQRSIVADHRVVSAMPLVVESDLTTLDGLYTPIEDFYVRNHGPIPKDYGPAAIHIEGEVEKPQVVTFEDLASSPKRQVGTVLECAGNPPGATGLVSNGMWEGWPLADILNRAKPLASARHIHLMGRDGYLRSVPLDRAYAEALLVTHLNGRALRRQHGAPWRALFPGWFGMDSVKWLQKISLFGEELASNKEAYREVTRSPSGSIQQRPLPRMQVKSIISSPLDGTVLQTGRTKVQGLAWSGEGRVSAVEVSGDGGESWRSASFEPGADHGWAVWRIELQLRRGATQIVCRATDEKGNQQPAERDNSRLDGYVNNSYHRIRCIMV